MMLKTCDQCHRRKLRCRRVRGEDSCRQCLHQMTVCSSDRKHKRMGRPPATKVFPHGITGIIRFEDDSVDNSLLHTEERGSRGIYPAAVFSNPPRSPASTPFSSQDRHEVLEVLFDRDRFSSFHHHFMIGPSFADQFRTAILMTLHDSQEVVMALHQTLLELLNSKESSHDENITLGFKEATRSLMCLQNIKIVHLSDAAAALLLGQILFVYHIMVMRTSAHAISQNCLLLTKNWYPMLMSQPDLRPITMTPVLVDTVDSLVRRRIPILKMPLIYCNKEDRTMGLSVSLLPILYDLCVVSSRAKALSIDAVTRSSAKHTGMNGDFYLEIERQIRQWEPPCYSVLFSKYSHIEVSAMMMQARVYRVAGLLLIHRLRYPLGVEDEEGSRLAMVIIAELSCFVKWAPEEVKDMAIYLPLFLAMIEVGKPAEQILSHLAPHSFYGNCANRLKDFVKLTRAAREAGFEGLWFDLVGKSLHTGIIP